jgi:hypothetical protein
MAQIERIVAIMHYETEEDMLEDLKNCVTVRRLRFRRKKNSYIYPKASFETRKILFIEKFNKEEE